MSLGASTFDANSDHTCGSMLRWLDDNGATVSHIRIVVDEHTGDRSVRTTQPLAAKSAIMRIPRSVMLTDELAKKRAVGQKLMAYADNDIAQRKADGGLWRLQPDEYNQLVLAVLLLEERNNPKSFWKPYIDCLPQPHSRAMSAWPVFWSAEELALLDGTLVGERIAQFKEQMRDIWRLFNEIAPEFCEQHTYVAPSLLVLLSTLRLCFRSDDLIWARLMVMSRAFNLKPDADYEPQVCLCVLFVRFSPILKHSCVLQAALALVPMADLPNHINPPVRSLIVLFTRSIDCVQTDWTYKSRQSSFVMRPASTRCCWGSVLLLMIVSCWHQLMSEPTRK